MTPDYHKADPPSQNRSVWFFILTIIALVGMFFGVRIYVDYKRTISLSEERLLTQARVIDENINTNLSVVNLMLNNVIKEQESTTGNNQLNGYLKQQIAMTPSIRALLIIDRQGRCLNANRDELIGKNFSDRNYFKVPRDASDKEMLFLSPPYTNVFGKYVISITKPLIGKNGDFNGVVTALLDPVYFSKLLKSTIYAPDNRVSLVHSDGTVFIAVPEAKVPVTGLNVAAPGSVFLQHINSGKQTSIRRGFGKTLGDNRILAYLTNIQKGLRFDKQIVVVASRNMDEVLAQWRMDAGIEFLIYLIFASLSIVITKVMLLRRVDMKRLDELRARLAAIIEFSDDAIISKDLDGVILSWNTGAERLFKYLPEEALGRSISMLIPPDRQEEENIILRSLIAGERSEALETVRVAKDGRRIDVLVTSSPIKDSSGKTIGASKIIHDISDRKRAEEAQSESRAKLDAALASMTDAVFISDAQGRFIEFNEAFATFHKFGSKDECARTFAEYPDLLDVYMADGTLAPIEMWAVPRALRGETVTNAEYTLRRKDTGETWVGSYSFAPICDENGDIVGSVVVGRDITEHKKTAEMLKESEERFRLFMDNNPCIVWIKDEQGRHVYLNMTYEERFGVRLADWRGKSDAEVWPADVAAEFRKNDLAVLEADRSIQITEETINPDGGRCHWLNTKFPYRDAAGNRFIAAIGLDITERKRAEAYRAMGQEILLILNQFEDLNEGMQQIMDLLRTTTGVEAVGIRLQQGDDYPYFSQQGFSQDFLSKENSLVTRMRDGGICMDEDGKPCLECTCGMVICEKIDPASPQCTKGGSIWTNDSYDILTLPPSEDPRSNPRNECIHHGYASVALIPIRAKGSVVGLLQLNDCRKGCFLREDIEALERIAENIGEAMLRKQAEYELKASLHEKEVLLKEIHHRVKNNMQVISSLVSLQADGSKDETVREVLKDVTYRVRSMALVHEKLYQSADLSNIDFSEYARSLLNYLWRAHGSVASSIKLTLDLEPVLLPVDTAVPCGLILNELAGNALKHAFRGRSEGEVNVSLRNGADRRIRLSVADNGVGLSEGLDWRQAKSLGLRLVQMLARQIDAALEVGSGEGAQFEIAFMLKTEDCWEK